MQKHNRKYYIYFGSAVLVIALVFGAGVTAWMGSGALWAAQDAQDTPGQLVNTVSAGQAEIAALAPTQDLLSRLYDETAPSVVSVQVTLSPSAAAIPGLPDGFPFGGEEDPPSGPSQPQGQGSGFIFDMDGHIVTNNHVVDNAESVVVYFHNGMWADAEVVATDPQADLAVLKVDPPEGVEWKPLPLASPEALLPGYYVIAFGSPFGLDETMTLGVVSAVGRSMPTGDAAGSSRYSLPDVVQTDTAINPGNSGGPLLNLKGEVVGINFAINSTAGSNSGVGFAIPVAVVEKVAPALIENGKFDYAYLGIAGQTITKPVAEEKELADNTLGVIVGEVVSSGPASQAGVQADDIIVGIDDAPVTQFEDLISFLFNSTEPGSEITLSVLRGDDTLTLDVTLGERPEAVAEQTGDDGESDAEITIAEAIKIAKEAVGDAELMASIESANAKRAELDGQDVWIVTLSGDDKAATVTVDAISGEVIELDVQ